MTLLPKEAEALKRARFYISILSETAPQKTRKANADALVGALLTVCLQHCESILILLETRKHQASVEALMRSCYESFLRLMWATENDQRARQLAKGEINFPRFSALAKSMSKRNDSDPQKTGELIEALHSSSHKLL
jgi:hypothetical protein